MKPIIIRKRWGMPPYGKFGGITLWPFIILVTGWKESTARHELIHWWEIYAGHLLLLPYRFIRFYILWIEQYLFRGYHNIDSEFTAYWGQLDEDLLPHKLELLAKADPKNG